MKLLQRLFKLRNVTTKPLVTAVTLTRPRIYILPTRNGLIFIFILIVMLLGSMNYNNNLGYLLTFILGSMMLVSILHTHRNLLGMRIEVGKASPVFAGEMARFQLWTDNREQAARTALLWQHQHSIHKTTSQASSNWVYEKFLWQHSTHKDIPPLVIDIPADQRYCATLAVPTTQRGRLPLGRVTVSTSFPLGLFYAWSYLDFDLTAIVYPLPTGRKNLPLGRLTEDKGEGNPVLGSGEDFIGYRDYKLGDSPRHVDWKAVARRQEWLLKQFGGMGVSYVWLTWEDVRSLHLEAALSQLCLWILLADSQGAQYGLKIPGTTIELNSGAEHRERCLQTLALYSTL